MIAVLFFLLCTLLCLWLLRREGLLKNTYYILTAVLALAVAFSLRYLALDHATLDYENFLTRWVDFYRLNGGFSALDRSVGNYNLPYLYFMALFSYTSYPDLYLIKFLSILFDILLAWAVMALCGCFTRSAPRRLAAFLLTLLLPTVILNGSYWGQCDSIYVSLALLSILYALRGRSRLSLVFITLSFAFKLQAVFFMPVFGALLWRGRVRWRDLWIVPLTYFLAVLPAVLAGRPLLDTITLYFNQTGSVGSGLNYNSPSLYAFYRGGGNETALARLGIGAAFVFCGVLLLWLCTSRKAPDDRQLLAAFLLTAICIPLLLPHMHDRYFFGADVLSLAAALSIVPLAPLPFLCSFASLLGYHAYLRMRYLLLMHNGTVALLAAVALLLGWMLRHQYGKTGISPPGEDFS